MSSKLRRRELLVAGAGLLLASRGARADSVDDKLAAITKARATLKTLVGPFTQVSTVGLLRTKVRATGMMYFQAPNRLRWELGAPDSVTYWVAPEAVAYRGQHGSGRLAVGARLPPDLECLRAVLGGDAGVLRSRFDVREAPNPDGAGPAFEATPKAGSPMRLRRMFFSMQPDMVRPHKAVMIFDERNQSEITFGELRRDAPIDPALLVLP
jgi:hypothetical protein